MDKNFLNARQNSSCRSIYAAVMLCLLVASLLTSCSPEAAQVAAVKDQEISKNYVQDPLTLHLRTNKKEITIAEQLQLVLETAVPENVEVEFPSYALSLGDFTLKDTRIGPARMTGSGASVRIVHQVTYLLEPYLSGTYTIPALEVTYHDRMKDAPVTKLVTEELQVPVLSLLGPDTANVEIKDIKPPLSLDPDRVLQFLVGAMVLLLAAVAASGFVYWKKRGGAKLSAPVQLRPEDIALQELDRLLAENLLAAGAVKLFHLRISDILRRYMENRFGMRAPERTTEEFLLELSRSEMAATSLLGSHKVLLADFLSQCDLVKFAKHEPTVAESEKTVFLCREFIEKTRAREGFEGSRGQGVQGTRRNEKQT